MKLPESARKLIESGVHAHPQESKKVRNIKEDKRVALTFESETKSAMDLNEYLVIYGQARIEEGGAPELLQKLPHVYLGPEVKFPPMDNPPPGFITRIQVKRVSGVGPWTGRPV